MNSNTLVIPFPDVTNPRAPRPQRPRADLLRAFELLQPDVQALLIETAQHFVALDRGKR